MSFVQQQGSPEPGIAKEQTPRARGYPATALPSAMTAVLPCGPRGTGSLKQGTFAWGVDSKRRGAFPTQPLAGNGVLERQVGRMQ
jgi:hypothetical protein